MFIIHIFSSYSINGECSLPASLHFPHSLSRCLTHEIARIMERLLLTSDPPYHDVPIINRDQMFSIQLTIYPSEYLMNVPLPNWTVLVAPLHLLDHYILPIILPSVPPFILHSTVIPSEYLTISPHFSHLPHPSPYFNSETQTLRPFLLIRNPIKTPFSFEILSLFDRLITLFTHLTARILPSFSSVNFDDVRAASGRLKL